MPSDTSQWAVQILELVNDICDWIDNLGGPFQITTSDVLYIIDVRLGIITETFTVTTKQVLGVIDYRLGNIPSGNNNTGCVY